MNWIKGEFLGVGGFGAVVALTSCADSAMSQSVMGVDDEDGLPVGGFRAEVKKLCKVLCFTGFTGCSDIT